MSCRPRMNGAEKALSNSVFFGLCVVKNIGICAVHQSLLKEFTRGTDALL